MELVVELAGCRLPWRFTGSSLLQGLLARRPWEQDELAVLRARTEPSVGATRALGAVAQAVRGADSAGALQLVLVEDCPEELGPALERLHNISPRVSGRRRLVSVAQALTRPTAWLLWHDGDGAQLESDILDLLDGVSKVSDACRLPLVLLLHTRGHGSRYDLSVGLPAEMPLADPNSTRHQLWSSYVHWRIAWLAGGRLGWAERIGLEVWPALDAWDDEGFERSMCSASEREWSELVPELRSATRRWLTAWPRTEPGLGKELAAEGTLWTPAHDPHRGLQPTPWVARALLRTDGAASHRSLLRACDSCEPLTVSFLMRCLRLEASLKAALEVREGGVVDARFQPEAEPRRLRDLHERLGLVPVASPSRASTLMDFGGLGFVIHEIVTDRRTASLARDLCDIRNALAHGHPPSWRMLVALADLWNRLPR